MLRRIAFYLIMISKKAGNEVFHHVPRPCLSDWLTFMGRTSAEPTILTMCKDKQKFWNGNEKPAKIYAKFT